MPPPSPRQVLVPPPTEDKPLSPEPLEPTYRKGSECWSEGTGRGSSRAFLGTPRLKFVLETEEKTEKLLVALKGFSAQHITLVAPGDSGAALKSSPTVRCPFQSPLGSPPPQQTLLSSTPSKREALYKAGTTGASSFRKLHLYTHLTPSSLRETPRGQDCWCGQAWSREPAGRAALPALLALLPTGFTALRRPYPRSLGWEAVGTLGVPTSRTPVSPGSLGACAHSVGTA